MLDKIGVDLLENISMIKVKAQCKSIKEGKNCNGSKRLAWCHSKSEN